MGGRGRGWASEDTASAAAAAAAATCGCSDFFLVSRRGVVDGMRCMFVVLQCGDVHVTHMKSALHDVTEDDEEVGCNGLVIAMA